MSKKSNAAIAEKLAKSVKPRTKKAGGNPDVSPETVNNWVNGTPETTELPDFLKPAAPVETTKQKPGPKAGVLKVTSPCPYCGEPAHRKAIQNVKGHGPLRRMYCANGCGHYHYRDVVTNAVVEGAGRGPRVDPLFVPKVDDPETLTKLQAELKTTKQALKRAERDLKNAPKATEGDWLFGLADTLGIDPGKLVFTADDGKGRPRALVNCLSEADKALFDRDGAETVEKLHIVLLTVQACIRAYKEKAATLAKGKK